MRFVVTFVLVLLSALSAQAYDAKQTVKSAQEALVRLGLDPGQADGKWSDATRDAMNALRGQNGLAPAADFVGSSLALVHRQSPGAETLSKPGLFVTPIPERRAFLAANKGVADEQCPIGVGNGVALSKAEPMLKVTTAAGSGGYITSDEDWYSPIMEGMMAAEDSCLLGDDKYCSSIVDFAERWAEADALKPGAKRGQKKFEDVS
jgi:hypothetical protein